MGVVKGKKQTSQERTEGLKAHFAKLKKDLSTMTFKEKVDHIWTYYKEYMLVVFIVLLIVGGILISIFMPKDKILLGGVHCNIRFSAEGYAYLSSEFHENVLGGADGKVLLRQHQFSGQLTVEDVDRTYQSYNAVIAYVEAKELDYMLLDEYAFTYFTDMDIYMDLRDLLPAEELQRLEQEGMLITEGTTQTPTAIDISKLPLCQQELSTGECILVFISNTPRKDACLKLWEHIKNYK